jgi:hypothetical protein
VGDQGVARMLGFEADEARQVMLGLFGYFNGRRRAPHLIGDHYAAWLAWVKRERDDLAARFAGE